MRFGILFFWICFSVSLKAQHEVSCKPISCKSDKLGYFFVMEKNKVLKLDTAGKIIGRYEDFSQGEFGAIDVTNPLKLVLFHPSLQRISFLDKSLNLIRTLDLTGMGYTNICAVTSAANGDYWLFDMADYKLKRINEDGYKAMESQPLYQQLQLGLQPQQILEYNSKIFVVDSIHGIFVFDQMGNYLQTFNLYGVSQIQIFQKEIYFFKEGKIVRLPMLNTTETMFTLTVKESQIVNVVVGIYKYLEIYKDKVVVKNLD